MDRKYGILLLACCIVCIAISGCTRSSSGQKPAGSDKTDEVVFIGPEISADCIVTFYDGQGSKYVSMQRHTIYPEDLAIRIEASEPEGDFTWELYNDVFKTVSEHSSKSTITKCPKEIAQAIVLSVSAAGGFLGDKAGLMQDPISIAGRMYQPIVLDDTANSPTIQKVYRETSSNQIDWVEIKNPKENVLIAAKSYNLRKIADTDKLIPATIEIYNTDKSGRPADRIMKIEYKSFELSPTK